MDESSLTPRGLCGLTNIGNTCYMNSALQALSNCSQLTTYFLMCKGILSFPEDGRMTVGKCYWNLLNEMWDRKRPKHLTPCVLLRAIRIHNSTFRGYAQQDTQEFLRCLMDRLHEELKKPVLESLSDNEDDNQEEDDDDDEELSLKKQKKLLGGNASSDDSPMDADVSQSMENMALHRQKRHSLTNSDKMNLNEPKHRKNRLQSNSISSSKKLINQNIKYRSIITTIFDGKLLSSVQCLTCNRVSNTVETYQDLSIPIPSKEDLGHMHTQGVFSCSPSMYNDTSWLTHAWSWLKSWFVGPDIQLQDCLSAFFTHDELKGDNMYSCGRCKKLRNGVKYSRVHVLPEVLCVHLKRFRHELYFSSKINTYISFPLYDLDMQQFISKDCAKSNFSSKYNLSALISHFGSVGGGHYIAYAKNCVDNKWYEFNDSFVSEVSETTVANAEAYVLFYSLNDNDAVTFRKETNRFLHKQENTSDIRYISKEWFVRFDTCVRPGCISNGDLLCKHGSIKLELVCDIMQLTIAIPKQLYDSLAARFGGGPEIQQLDVCRQCKALTERKDMELQTFIKLHEEFGDQDDIQFVNHISMKWYDAWYAFVTGKRDDPPGLIDNSDISEDNLSNNKEEASYGCISPATWDFLYSVYGGGPVIAIEQTIDKTNNNNIENQ